MFLCRAVWFHDFHEGWGSLIGRKQVSPICLVIILSTDGSSQPQRGSAKKPRLAGEAEHKASGPTSSTAGTRSTAATTPSNATAGAKNNDSTAVTSAPDSLPLQGSRAGTAGAWAPPEVAINKMQETFLEMLIGGWVDRRRVINLL